MESLLQPEILSQNVVANNGVINEKSYPITKLWIFKTPIIIVLMNLVALFFGYYFPYLVLALPVMLIANPLIRANFHYSLDDKYFHVNEGVISKKQRNLPYGVIQNVFLKQDLFDRIFGLATLRIENASQAGGDSKVRWWNKGYGSKSNVNAYGQGESLGSSGNKVNLPGLKKQNAEDLRNFILQKVKENPIEESGL